MSITSAETASRPKIAAAVREVFNLTPKGIIASLNLTTTKYLPTAKNGHFGNESFPWESTALAADLKQAAGA